MLKLCQLLVRKVVSNAYILHRLACYLHSLCRYPVPLYRLGVGCLGAIRPSHHAAGDTVNALELYLAITLGLCFILA